jgi:glycosyltransferase involved in cell wall biosynthesis
MKILTYTSLYPNAVDPNHGIFAQNRMLNCARRYEHELQVVAPVPYFPNIPLFPKWSRFSQIPAYEVRQGVPVFHPRYLVTPKVGMLFYGFHMFWGTLGTVRKLRQRFDFEIIDAQYLYPDGFAANLLGRILNKPVVVTAHGKDVNLFSRLFGIRNLIRFTLRHSSAVIAVCQALKDRIVNLGISDGKVHVIGNGADIQYFYPAEQLAARNKLNLPADRKTLLCVAQLTERKRIHLLIDAVQKLRQQRPDLLLLLLGGRSDTAYVNRLQRQVAQSGLQDNVRFVGEKPHQELGDWYNASDLFCLFSSREGMPCVLLEALACGKPVVASRVDGIPEVISTPDYGLLVDSSDPLEYASAIHKALNTQWRTHDLVSYARRNSWEELSSMQHAVFQQAISEYHKSNHGNRQTAT